MVHQTVSNLYNSHRKPFTKHKLTKRNKAPVTKDARKIAEAKRQATLAAKRARKVQQDVEAKKNQLKPEDFPDGPPVPKLPPNNLPNNPDRKLKPPVLKGVDINWVFTPNPGPQTSFLSSTEEEVLYGGGAGGGKSYAMLADPMRYFYNPNFVGLLLRRTNDELRELKWESQKLYPKAFPGAKWKEQDSMWVFPSGAKFWMTYLDREDDVLRYQGQSFCWIGVDELTQYPTPHAYLYLKSRLRSSDPELEKNLSMRATTNPGGPGHHWVKKMFIDPAPAGQAFWATDIDTGEVLLYPDDYKDPITKQFDPTKAGKPLSKRKFIPALLKDNPYLYESGHYEKNLLSLPEDQRRKLLEGDWSIVEGAAFPEFSVKQHVVKPFEIPHSWRRFRAADYGYASPSCVLWFAIDPQYETLYVYRELYASNMTGVAMAQKVLELEKNEKISYGVLDSSVWHQRGIMGPTVAEEMIAAGCSWRPSDRGPGSREAGKNRLHELLKVKERNFGDMEPSIKFFENCRQVISDLPSIPSDPDGGDDIDDRYPNDHSYDALRYGIMSRPRASSPLDWGRQSSYRYNPADEVFGY
jgi:hypothetical protein